MEPDDAEDFSIMATKELQRGRLAMLATAGLVAQELVDRKEILVHAGLAPDNFDPSSLSTSPVLEDMFSFSQYQNHCTISF